MASLWQTLLKSVLETEAVEITCQECFSVLDLYAEALANGGDAARIMPKVRQHLRQCVDCNDQLEALMIMLQQTRTKA